MFRPFFPGIKQQKSYYCVDNMQSNNSSTLHDKLYIKSIEHIIDCENRQKKKLPYDNKTNAKNGFFMLGGGYLFSFEHLILFNYCHLRATSADQILDNQYMGIVINVDC